MLAYYRWHPGVQGGMAKHAASNALARFFLGLGKRSGLASSKPLGSRVKQFARNNALGIAGAVTGTLGGAWLGNMAYRNAVPPVRALPQLEQEPYVSAINTTWQAQETDGY